MSYNRPTKTIHVPLVLLLLFILAACNPLGQNPKIEEAFSAGFQNQLSSLSYSTNHLSLSKNSTIESISPIIVGEKPRTYSVSPELPTGLVLNPTTGEISGTPTELRDSVNYVVTGTLGKKSVSTIISLSVVSTSSTQSSVVVNSSLATANGSSLIYVTVTLLDISGRPISGNTVSLNSNRGEIDTITTLSGITNSLGLATFSIQSTKAGNAILSAIDTTENLNLTNIQPVSFIAGPGTKVSFSVNPSNSAKAGVLLATQPMVQIQDAFNNIISTSTDSVSLGLYLDSECSAPLTTTPNGSNSTTGPMSVNAISGVASFSGIKINKAANALYLKATSGSLASDCSNGMTISAATFSKSESSLSVNLATVNAGSTLILSLIGKDTFGNLNPTDMNTVNFSSTSTAGTGVFSSPITNAGGGIYTSSFSGLSVGEVTLSGFINGEIISDTKTITVSHGPIASLHFLTQPSIIGDTDSILDIQPTVVAKDAQGNIITSDSTTTIILSAHSNSTCTAEVNSGISQATNTLNLSSGIANFSNVKLLKTNIKRILASDGTHTVCSNSNITIAPGSVASIAFSTQPSISASSDSAISIQPVITAYDANSNIVTNNSSSTITLTGHSDSSCTSPVASGLSATINPLTLNSGIAVFSNVKLLKTSVKRILASDGTHSICSNADITNAPGNIASLAFTIQPSNLGNADSPLAIQPQVTAYDSNSNIVTDNSTSTITLTVHSDASCASSAIPNALTASINPALMISGVTTFNALTIKKTSAIRIKATTGSVSICSNPISISPGAVATIAFTTQPSNMGNADSALATQPVVTAYDAYSNIASNNSTSMITLTAHSNSSCTSEISNGVNTTSNPARLNSGIVSFSGIKVLKSNTKRILASDGIHSVCSESDISISAGALASIVFSNQPSSIGNADSPLATQPSISGLDANYNVVASDYTSMVTLSAHNDSSCSSDAITSGVIANSNPLLMTAGVALFTGVTIKKTSAIRLKATSGLITSCSDPISISPGSLASLAFTTQPSSNGNADSALSSQPILTGYDANLNVVDNNSTSSITLSAHSDSICSTSAIDGGVVSNSNPVIMSSGIATFSGVNVRKTNVTRLKASNGTVSVCSNSLIIAPGTLASISFSTQPSSSGNADSALSTQPVLTGYDANGNIVANNSVSAISLSAHSDSSCSTAAISNGVVANSNPVTLISGIGTFSGVNVRKTNATRLKATSGLISICSNALSITAGALNSTLSTLSTAPLTIAADGTTTSHFSATILDQYSNPISDQSVSLVSSRGATDTITTSPATTNSSGQANLTVKTSTMGSATLTLTAGSFSQTRQLNYLSYTPIFDFQARVAKDGTNVGDSTLTTWWKNLYLVSTSQDFQLFNFSNPNTAWSGNGSSTLSTDPYRLTFSSGSSQYLEATTDLNSSNDVVFETWARPSSSTTKGSIILSNGNSSNKGFVLQQSSTEAGRIEFKLGTTNTYTDEVLADNPVSYWKLNDPAGTTAYDLKNLAANGTIVGPGPSTSSSSSAWNDGSKAMTFDGSDDYVTFGDLNLAEPGTNNFSVEFWLKTTDTNGWIISKSRCDSSTNRWALSIGNTIATSGSLGLLFHGSSQLSGQVSGVINDGSWHHIVLLVNRSGSATTYVDGVASANSLSVSANAATNLNSTYDLVLGTYNNGSASNPTGTGTSLAGGLCGSAGAAQLAGSVHDLAIYHTLLSPERILAHYQAGARPVCRSLSTLTNSTWTHIAGLFNSTSGAFKLFLNGTEECSITLPNPTNLYAGSDSTLKASPSPYWSGDLSEIRAANSTVPNNNMTDNYINQSVNYPSFTPSDVSGLKLWLDASDSSTLFQNTNCTSSPVTTNGDVVACWKDKSGNALHATQSTAARQPFFTSTSVNSKPGVTFGAVDYDLLQTPSTTLAARTYFVVTKKNGTRRGTYESWILQSGNPYHHILADATGYMFNFGNSAGFFFRSNISFSGNQLITAKMGAGLMTLRINGNNSYYNNSSFSGTSITSVFYFGGFTAAYGINGDILEILVYNSVLAENDVKRIEAYLNAKYKLY